MKKEETDVPMEIDATRTAVIIGRPAHKVQTTTMAAVVVCAREMAKV